NRPRRVNPAGLMKVLRLRPDGRWHWHWDPEFLAHRRLEVPGQQLADVFDAALGNVHVPTLLVRGVMSDVVTDEGVEQFLDRVPNARLADVQGAAHMVAGDRNDAFSDAVIDFLEKD